jgi:hypothetical protein
VVDAETEALRASGIECRTLHAGAVAPDFMLPDAQGRCVRLQSLLRQGPDRSCVLIQTPRDLAGDRGTHEQQS